MGMAVVDGGGWFNNGALIFPGWRRVRARTKYRNHPPRDRSFSTVTVLLSGIAQGPNSCTVRTSP